MTTELDELCAWAAGLAYRDIADEARDAARDVLLDDTGVMLAGSAEQPLAALRRERLQYAGRGMAVVCGLPPLARVDALSAAELNGMAACWLELDEGYRIRGCHAGLYTVPALLALSQANDLSGEAALEALAAAYEVVTRAARAWRLPRQVAHVHGVFSPIGAAAVAAKLLHYDAATFAAAIRGAAALALVAPYRQAMEGALVRNAWAGAGARLGIQAALNARHGVAGSATASDQAFARALGAETRPEELTRDLGKELAVVSGYHKPYACCRHLHAAVSAALDLHGEWEGRAPDEMPTRILVQTHPDAAGLDAVAPHNMLAAKFSLPHAVSVALATGSAATAAFEEGAIRDPRVASLRERVDIEVLPDLGDYPDDRATQVTLEWANGASDALMCRRPPGDPSRPLGHDQLVKKFTSLASRVLSPEGLQYTLNFLEGVEAQPSMRSLFSPGGEPRG